LLLTAVPILLQVFLLSARQVRAQTAAIASKAISTAFPPGSVTIDAAKLDSVLSLDGPWRFHLGDDTAFASPTFDDSTWPLLKPAQTFDSAHLSVIPRSYTWLRLHLHVLNANYPLGVSIATNHQQQFELYANGQRIGTSPGAISDLSQFSKPFAIALPAQQDLVLALRIGRSYSETVTSSPLAVIQIGALPAVSTSVDLASIRNFNDFVLTDLLSCLVLLASGTLVLILFLTQRRHKEYLWLSANCFVAMVFLGLLAALELGLFAISRSIYLLFTYFGWAMIFTNLEFVARFTKVRSRIPLHAFEVYLVLAPMLSIAPGFAGSLYSPALVIMSVGWFVFALTYLIRSYRRGNGESGVLVLPYILLGILYVGENVSRGNVRFVHIRDHFNWGYVGTRLANLDSVVFMVIIVAVVLYRFNSVSKDEERSAAELEAARTVQQVLIPEELPSIAGLSIASVYQPAQLVGGDFFQIMPVAQGGALVVLGDVSGKGMQAAMTVSLLVGAFRTAAETTVSPAALMETLNRRLHGRGVGFTTCLILNIAANGEVAAANAGHLRPYLNGTELELEVGLPLGFTPDASYLETHFILCPACTLTLLTDGVVEATHPTTRELFGFDRTQAMSTQSAEAIAAAAQLFGHGAPQSDDITVLTITHT
jgi:Stage II sporulation protein E (SpoIIE)